MTRTRDDNQQVDAPSLTEKRVEGGSQPAAKSLPPTSAQNQLSPIQVDDSRAVVCYSNFCRVTGTPEELILDSGLNSNPAAGEKVEIKQRLILNYYTAKRLMQALQLSVQRHEQAFGVLETDVQKRVVRRPALAAGNRT